MEVVGVIVVGEFVAVANREISPFKT